MSDILLKRKEKLYRWMYEFTQTQCTACSMSGCACKDSICAHVEIEARKRGAEFSHTGHALRFIGKTGCVVPPHLRETCTIYVCDQAQRLPSFKAEKYLRLKKIIDRLEWRLMASEDCAQISRKTASQIS